MWEKGERVSGRGTRELEGRVLENSLSRRGRQKKRAPGMSRGKRKKNEEKNPSYPTPECSIKSPSCPYLRLEVDQSRVGLKH